MLEADRARLAGGPIILLGRGGSGTRLLSEFALGLGIFLGNRINITGDSLEWVDAIYDIAIEELTTGIDPGSIRDLYWRDRLCRVANEILERADHPVGHCWGWKLPETMLALGPILRAFPNARVVHLVRHPLTSAIRRTHVTSRTDNPIGELVLQAAYRACGMNPALIGQDEAFVHNAKTWAFQVKRVLDILRLSEAASLQVRYEEICADPRAALTIMADFLGFPSSPKIPKIDQSRTNSITELDDRARRVWAICGETARALGYDAGVLCCTESLVARS